MADLEFGARSLLLVRKMQRAPRGIAQQFALGHVREIPAIHAELHYAPPLPRQQSPTGGSVRVLLDGADASTLVLKLNHAQAARPSEGDTIGPVAEINRLCFACQHLLPDTHESFSKIHQPSDSIPGTASALKRLSAIGVALLDLSDGVHARFPVLVLDISGNAPALVTEQLQDSNDGCVALAERQVVSVILLAILDVQGHDAIMVLAD